MSDCKTIQLIEPDSDTLTVAQPGSLDPALSERGDLILAAGQTSANVTFAATKLSADYRFEFLYVDALGELSPGAITCVPTSTTVAGFTVQFSGAPLDNGYVLRWRVVVETAGTLPVLDQPENLYVQMPQQIPTPPITPPYLMDVTFVNPRSTTSYGFSELRVENLIDPPSSLVPVVILVVAKTTTNFTIWANPPPNSPNYFLKVRTP